jgi:hypothetical protein
MSSEPRIIDRDLGWIDLFKLVREIRHAHVKVGVIAESESTSPPEKAGALTVAEIAVVNEFGTEDGRIPARSFVRASFDEQREKLVELGANLMKQVIDRKLTLDRALGILGLSLATSIKLKIRSSVPPPDAPSTVAAKGSATTLVDTGRLLHSITWAVDKNGEGE